MKCIIIIYYVEMLILERFVVVSQFFLELYLAGVDESRSVLDQGTNLQERVDCVGFNHS